MTADVGTDMTTSAIAELLAVVGIADAADALGGAATVEDLRIELPTDPRTVPWAGGIIALRWEGRWTRGRADGGICVDLVGAGPVSTLLTVELEQPGGWLPKRVTPERARVLARRLRDGIERAPPARAGTRGTEASPRERTPSCSSAATRVVSIESEP